MFPRRSCGCAAARPQRTAAARVTTLFLAAAAAASWAPAHATAAAPPKEGTTLKLQSWLTAIDPLAVCSDGSSAGYYFAPGSGSGANVWVIFLQGGLWCWDQQTCATRQQTQPDRMGSATWKEYYGQPGLLSSEQSQSPFYNANMAFVPACTSDSWAGDNEYDGFQFRGSRVVSAVVQALLYDHGMASQPSARLLLGGCSSGGNGAMFNLDMIADKLPSSVQLRGMLDAASWVDVKPLEESGLTLQAQTQLVMKAALPPVPPYCLSTFTDDDLWKCIWPSYRLPLLQTPFFLNAFQFDTYQTMEDVYGTDDAVIHLNTTDQFNFVDSLQQATLAMFSSISPSKGAIFSSACQGHCLTMLPMYSTFTVDGMTMAQAMQQWYFDGDSQYRNIQNCIGWDCTHQCSNVWQPVNVQCPSEWQKSCGTMPGSGGSVPQQAPPKVASGGADPYAKQGGGGGDGGNSASDWPYKSAGGGR